MKTHNRLIYHCLCCGRVTHLEPEESRPHCCGQRMVKAASETVCESDETGTTAHKPKVDRQALERSSR
jgi:hypothetical protein